jgi:hypothetical protein
MSNGQMTMQGPQGSYMMNMLGSIIKPSMGYAPSMAVCTSSLVVSSCVRYILSRQHVHAHIKEAFTVYPRGKCPDMPISRLHCTFVSHLRVTTRCSPWLQHTCYLRICLVADYCAHDGAAPNMTHLRVSCMQSHLQYASSFNLAHRAMWPAV